MERDRRARPRILIAAYDYPPIVSAGMYRITSLSRSLEELGWNVTVLTVENSYVHQAEWTLRLIPENVRVVRTRTFEYFQLRRALRRTGTPGGSGTKRAGTAGVYGGRHGNRTGGIRAAIKKPLSAIDQLLTFPDAKAGWFAPLYRAAARLLSSESFDMVLSSSPPHSIHLPFLFLKKRFDFRWAADFRDPWTTPRRARWNPIGSPIQRRMERRVLLSSDCIIANTPGNKRALQETFPEVGTEKIEVITNGFDARRVVRRPAPVDGEEKFDFLFVGTVYPGMLDTYVSAIKHIREEGKKRPPRLRIVGTLGEEVRRDLISANGLDYEIVFEGRVSFDDGYDLMNRANALLLLLPHGPGFDTWVPSKLYTYLSTSMPICALIPRGDASDILENTGGGLVIDSTDPVEAARRIREFLDGVASGELKAVRNRERLRDYTWEVLGERFDKLLRNVCRGGEGGTWRTNDGQGR